MIGCATVLGLLCIGGVPAEITENPHPRLYFEEKVSTPDYEITHLLSDLRYHLSARKLRHACKGGFCIRYDVISMECGLAFHLFRDDGDGSFEGGESYTLSSASKDNLILSLSQISVFNRSSKNPTPILLNKLPGFEKIDTKCP